MANRETGEHVCQRIALFLLFSNVNKGQRTMDMSIVFTLTGTDRVGIVDEVTKGLLDLGGNIEASRMAHLGGEFAVLMLVSLPSGSADRLQKTMDDLTARGYKVTATPTEQRGANLRGLTPYRIEVSGADHEGIVHGIAHILAEKGINIESMDTGNTRAPNSGAPLFNMQALVLVPADLAEERWREELERTGRDLHVDITITPAG